MPRNDYIMPLQGVEPVFVSGTSRKAYQAFQRKITGARLNKKGQLQHVANIVSYGVPDQKDRDWCIVGKVPASVQPTVLRELRKLGARFGAYVGEEPPQNFEYVA